MTKNKLMKRFTRDRKDVPVRRAEWNPLSDFQSEMNSLFDDFFSDFSIAPRWGGSESQASVFSPSMDLSESKKEVKLSVELPGMDEKDVKVEMQDNAIIISGEKKSEKEEEDGDWHVREHTFGMFRRAIPLPVRVDVDQAKATFKKGVLTVRVPKRKESEVNSKSIKILTE